MSKYVVVSAEWLDKTLQFLDCEKERRMADLEKRGVVVPLTPAQERAGDDKWVVVHKNTLFDMLKVKASSPACELFEKQRMLKKLTAEQEGE